MWRPAQLAKYLFIGLLVSSGVLQAQDHRPALGVLAGIAEYKAPAEYAKWWVEIAECEKVPLPPDKIASTQFFAVNAFSFVISNDTAEIKIPAMGRTSNPANQIFVGFYHIWDVAVIKHEMLHLLLYWDGRFNPMDPHPVLYYNGDVGKCGVTEHYQYR